MEAHQVAQLLSQTLSPDVATVHAATDALDRLSSLSNFSFCLLSVVSGAEEQGLKIAAATYLKNYARRSIDTNDNKNAANLTFNKDLRDALMRVLLQAEPVVLKILIEAFRAIVAVDFVKQNLWPELVPQLQAVIINSDLIHDSPNPEWKTINALTILHSLIRPFQYFLNPKLAKEPVPPQLDLIAEEILVPLVTFLHQIVRKASSSSATCRLEDEKMLLMICKCIYFAVRSYMPSRLVVSLPSICSDLIGILDSLSFDVGANYTDAHILRQKAGKRSLSIFSALVTRHRKFSDKMIPNIIGCALKLVRHSAIVSKLELLSERIVSLAFDVISRILETGPDKAEWEEDADEYMRKNLPSELEEISGWREDLFTARKSALNLLGLIAMSKGPPVANSSVSSKRKKGEKNKRKDRSSMGELLVLPFLAKFPIPTNANTRAVNEYYGVLMAYSSLLDFLKEQKQGFTTTLIQNRLLPLYKESLFQPYLVASANWVLGELASFIPEEMRVEIYSSLIKALTMPAMGEVSCYPVRMSAAGAISQLVENNYMPPEWLPLLQVVVGRLNDEEESAVIFQLLCNLVEAGNEHIAPHIPHIVSSLVEAITNCIPSDPGPWPQMVESGFATLAVMAQCWLETVPEETERNELSERWASGQVAIKNAFSYLLQHAWLRPPKEMEEFSDSNPSPSCMNDASTLLGFIMQDIVDSNGIFELKMSDLLLVWSDLIADWHAWEEEEDISIFRCIKEAISLNKKYPVKHFLVGELKSPPAPPVRQHSIVEGICSFVTDAFSQYPSAVWRASSCVHMLLHIPCHAYEGEEVKQSLVLAFCQAAFSRLKETKSNPCSLWKPLLLALSSCYLCCSEIVEEALQKTEHGGFIVFASALTFILTSKYEHSLSVGSEIKLAVLALAKVVEKLVQLGIDLPNCCLTSFMEACLNLPEVEEEDAGHEESEESGDVDTEDDDEEEDSEEDEREETEEEFLERCAEAANALEDGIDLEEGDVDDQNQEIDLGVYEEIDVQVRVVSLLERYHKVLMKGDPPPSEMVSSFLGAFPECSAYLYQLQQ